MKPQGYSALSAVFVTVALLASACSATTTAGVRAPENPEDRGFAATPLQAATTTASPPAVPDRVPSTRSSATPAPAFDTGSADERYPLWSGAEFTPKIGPLVSVAYEQLPIATTLLNGSDGLITALGITPDNNSAWFIAPDPHDEIEPCPGNNVGRILSVMPLNAATPPVPASPSELLPPNVSELHVGPENWVLLYSSCGGLSRPAAFARSTNDGNFTDVVDIESGFEAIDLHAPRWIWAKPSDRQGSFEVPSTLVAVIPRTSSSGSAELFIDVATGALLDIYPTDLELSASIAFQTITSDGQTLTFNFGADTERIGPHSTLQAQPMFAADGSDSALAAGEAGAMLITYRGEERSISELSTRPVTDATWAPSGGALALSDRSGTRVYVAGQMIQVSSEVGKTFFSRDGSRLLVSSPQQSIVYEFPQVDRPDDASQVTAFSQLDSGGLGPIRVGSTVSDLRSTLGFDLEIQGVDAVDIGFCVWVDASELPGVAILGEAISETDAIITSVTAYSGPWTTPSGLQLGSTEDQVYAALGDQVTQEPHQYITGNYLTFEPTNELDPNGVKFETNGFETFAITVGQRDWIGLVEGCL